MAFTHEEINQLEELFERKLDQKLDEKFDEKLAPIVKDIHWLKAEVLVLGQRLMSLEKRVTKIEEKVNYLHQYLNERCNKIDVEVILIHERLDSMHTMISEDIVMAYRGVEEVKRDLNSLKKRISLLEKPSI